MRIDSSGDRKQRSPLTGDWNSTPCSLIVRSLPRLKTWNPPESVRIGPVPAHEAVQAPVRLDHVDPGPQPKVEGIRQDDLRTDLLELGRAHRLDRPVRPDRHERGCLDGAVRQRQAPAPCVTVARQHLEAHAHARLASLRQRASGDGSISIASP